MREDTLITEVRHAAQLPDGFADYPDARIRLELNSILQRVFAPELVAARCGMLLKRHLQSVTLAAGRTYPLPGRAMAAGFEALDITDGTTYWPIKQIEPHEAWSYETTTVGRPQFYTVVGSSVRFYPAPDATYTVRYQYYLRPSAIVEKQTLLYAGVISAISSTGLITIESLRTDVMDRVLAASISSTAAPIDVIRIQTYGNDLVEAFDSSYEVVFPSAGWTPGASNFDIQLTAAALAQDISEMRVGDVVRAANQSEWPAMPHEYHPTLAMATAAKICRDRGMYNAATELDGTVRADLDRMRSAISPRVKSEAQRLRPAAHMLRRGYF